MLWVTYDVYLGPRGLLLRPPTRVRFSQAEARSWPGRCRRASCTVKTPVSCVNHESDNSLLRGATGAPRPSRNEHPMGTLPLAMGLLDVPAAQDMNRVAELS